MLVNFLSSYLIFGLILPIGVAQDPIPEVHTEPVEVLDALIVEASQQTQEFTVSPSVEPVVFERSSYSATTPEEIKAIHEEKARLEAEEKARAEAERAKAAEEQARKNRAVSGSWQQVNTGEIKCNTGLCWPLTGFGYQYDINGFQTPNRPTHNGFDMMIGAGTPIHAVADGVVRVSSEGQGGFGVMVMVDSVVDGQKVTFTYAHMTYGSRTVQAGDKVTSGQMLGRVGSTGNSTANHLHLEIAVNGNKTDPHVWLMQRIG